MHPDPLNLSALRLGRNRAKIYPKAVAYEDVNKRLGIIEEDFSIEQRDETIVVVWRRDRQEEWIGIGPADAEAALAIRKMMEDYETEKSESAMVIGSRKFGHRLRWDASLGPIRLAITGSKRVMRLADDKSGIPSVYFSRIRRPTRLGIVFDKRKWGGLLQSGWLTVEGNLLTITPPKSADGRLFDLDPDLTPSGNCLHRNYDTSSPTWSGVRDASTSRQQITDQAAIQSYVTSSPYIGVTRHLIVWDTSGYAEWASAQLQMEEINIWTTSGGQVSRAFYHIGGLTIGGNVTDSGHFDGILSVQTGTTVTHSGDDWTVDDLQEDATWGDSDFHISFVGGEDNDAGGGQVGDYYDVSPSVGQNTGVEWNDETVVIEVTGAPGSSGMMLTGMG